MIAAADAEPKIEEISGKLPQLFFLQYEMVPLNLTTLWIILPFAVIMCGVGLIESLMTLTLIDEITEDRVLRIWFAACSVEWAVVR